MLIMNEWRWVWELLGWVPMPQGLIFRCWERDMDELYIIFGTEFACGCWLLELDAAGLGNTCIP